MSLIHIANTNFEWELEQEYNGPLEDSFHSLALQLQYLPLLYRNKEDLIAVSNLPEKPMPAIFLFDDPFLPPNCRIESWAPSQTIAKWAKQKGHVYEIASWEVIKKVNSKQFSFSTSAKLPNSSLLFSKEEVTQWLKTNKGHTVLKTCFGVSGKGHLHLPEKQLHLDAFLSSQFAKKLPVIGEPWVKRTLDFSTQWIIEKSKKITFLGTTLCINTPSGKYIENQVGFSDTLLPKHLLDTHVEACLICLQQMADLNFFGNVGIDAMLYNYNQLHPIVEINARKTMGWFCLQIQKRYFPKQHISVSYAKKGIEKLLPSAIYKKDGSLLRFDRNLKITELSTWMF